MINVKTKTFLGMLKAIRPVIPGWARLPVLANYLISSDGINLSVTATDLEVFAQAICYGDGVSVGRVAIPPIINKLIEKIGDPTIDLDFLSDTPEENYVETQAVDEQVFVSDENISEVFNADKLKISFRAGLSNYTLQGMKPDDFPGFPSGNITESITVYTKELVDGLTICKSFVSTDVMKQVLTGIFYNGEKLIGCDGHMIVNYQLHPINTKKECSIILPVTLIDVLSKVELLPEIITLDIGDDGFLYISIPQLRLAIKLVEGNYPATDAIKFSNQPGFIVSRKCLKSAIQFHKNRNKFNQIVRFCADDDELRIFSGNELAATENSVVIRNGNSSLNKINSQYLDPQKINKIIESLIPINPKEIRINLGENPNITTFIPCGHAGIKCGLMQMQVNPKNTEPQKAAVKADDDQEKIKQELAIAEALINEVLPVPPTLVLLDCITKMIELCDRLTTK